MLCDLAAWVGTDRAFRSLEAKIHAPTANTKTKSSNKVNMSGPPPAGAGASRHPPFGPFELEPWKIEYADGPLELNLQTDEGHQTEDGMLRTLAEARTLMAQKDYLGALSKAVEASIPPNHHHGHGHGHAHHR